MKAMVIFAAAIKYVKVLNYTFTFANYTFISCTFYHKRICVKPRTAKNRGLCIPTLYLLSTVVRYLCLIINNCTLPLLYYHFLKVTFTTGLMFEILMSTGVWFDLTFTKRPTVYVTLSLTASATIYNTTFAKLQFCFTLLTWSLSDVAFTSGANLLTLHLLPDVFYWRYIYYQTYFIDVTFTTKRILLTLHLLPDVFDWRYIFLSYVFFIDVTLTTRRI